MKIEISKNKKKFRKGGFHTNPNIGWGLVLSISLFLVLASFVFGAFVFFRTNSELAGAPPPGNNSQIKIVKKERIEKVLEYFSRREKASAEILNSRSSLSDPSL